MRTYSKCSALTEGAWSNIALVQYPFIGGIKLGDDNQTFYREISPGPQYVGTPSMAIDLAWNKLLLGELRLFQQGRTHMTVYLKRKLVLPSENYDYT